MDFFEVIQSRHSVRSFIDRPVEPDKIQTLLSAINRAPSAGNLQAYEVYLVQDAARRAALVSAAWGQDYIAQAPLVLVFCTHPARSEKKYGQRGACLYALQDATIACTYAMLAATALGLSSVWVGAFQEESARQALQIPAVYTPVAILPIGYAAHQPSPTSRRHLSDLIH